MSESLLAALRPARARLDLDRLAANYLAVAAAAGRPVMPVVKADAYGHGAARVSRHLVALGAPMLAVAYAEEGAVLRSAGIRAPIVVLAGIAPGQVRSLVQHELTAVVSTPSTLELVLQAGRRQPLVGAVDALGRRGRRAHRREHAAREGERQEAAHEQRPEPDRARAHEERRVRGPRWPGL